MSGSTKVMVVAGTRPEAIKVAPVVRALDDAEDFSSLVCVTRQHDLLLDQALGSLGLVPDLDLDVFAPDGSMTATLAAVIERMGAAISAHRPDVVLVQGDTLSVLAGALAALYEEVPVAHLEAGLRSGLRNVPFPEEANRRATSQVADIHLAPTETNRAQLLAERIPDESIYVTGNTGIDSLHWMLAHPATAAPQIAALDLSHPLVVVTAHRRESWGRGLADIAAALSDLLDEHPALRVVLPVHANPRVRAVFEEVADRHERLWLVEPVSYPDMCRLLGAATLLLTDSGGLQEEAPALGLPVLVLRQATERPEALESGLVELVGTDRSRIVTAASAVLEASRLAPGAPQPTRRPSTSPFGDGHAATRVVAALRCALRGGPRPAPFASPPAVLSYGGPPPECGTGAP